MHDVTVSVWNRFWSFPLIEGLSRAGFDVLCLGSTRRGPAGSMYRCCWPSGVATQLMHRVPFAREQLLRFALDSYQRFATLYSGESRALWGWSGHHLDAFRSAKERGHSVIVETGSTHANWALEVLQREYALRGCESGTGALRRIAPRLVSEYDIADAICVPSQFVAQTFKHYGIPAEKLHVNPFGVDVATWGTIKRSFDPAKPFRCIYTGQIMLRKGIAYLLEAWRDFARPHAELLLVGPVWDDAKSILQKLPPGVKLLGQKSHSELQQLYSEVDLYILPSLEEGLARSVLEAMAAGVPILVTAETGICDIASFPEDGWLVPSTDAGSILGALEEAWSDRQDCHAKGLHARNAASAFTWEAYGERAAQFLVGLAGNPRPG